MKDMLKTIKLNEGTISMLLGAAVVAVVGLLIINYVRNLQNSPGITQRAAQDSRSAQPGEHIVGQGESLWSIAQKYYNSGYNWVDIAEANKLGKGNFIEVGQKLTIPTVEAKVVQAAEAPPTQAPTPVTTPVAMPESEPSATISSSDYTVVKGDNLWEISVRAYGDGYKWTEVAKTNKLKNPDLIYPDQQLTLPR